MSVSLRTNRGTLGSIPTLGEGEQYYATDTEDLYIGVSGPANQLIRSFPPSFISGLPLTWLTSGTLQVGAGYARNKADTANMELASAVTVDITATGALGVDSFNLTGTGAVAATSAITGTGTAFLTEFGISANLTGTASSASTTITGTGTKFLSEVSINDLIGNATKGYYRVSAIASDTSLTIASAPSSAFSGDTVKRIEQPTIKVAAQAVRRVNTITSDTAMTAETTWTGTSSGNTLTAGGINGIGGNQSLYLWLASGGSGTTVYLSGQRTTPFAVTGYTTSTRRIGSVQYNNTDTTILPFLAERQGQAVRYTYALENGASASRIVSAASATAWTRVTARGCVPSTACTIVYTLYLFNPANNNLLFLRPGGLGSATTTNNCRAIAVAGGRASTAYEVGVDGAQCSDWVLNAADANNPAYIDVNGYSEVL